MRAFLALEIDADMRARIGDAVAALRQAVPGVRWVAAEGLHLTLRFLGHTSPEVLAAMAPELRAASAACPAGQVRLAGLGMFPERGSPRVLWIGMELPRPVFDLQARSERAAVAAGLAPEPRAFRPHLTLGRWRDRASRPSLPPLDLGLTPVDRLVLFRSQLRPTGAIYTPLETFPLGPAPSGS